MDKITIKATISGFEDGYGIDILPGIHRDFTDIALMRRFINRAKAVGVTGISILYTTHTEKNGERVRVVKIK
jgi:hypothetical protein